MTIPTHQVLFNQSFNDFCAFREAVSRWETDFMLTSWNGFKATLYQSLVNGCVFSQVALNCNLDQRGLSPTGMRTFVIPCNDAVQYIWRKYEVRGNVIQFFPLNGELASISNHTFDSYIVSFPNQLVEVVALQLGFDPSPGFLNLERTWRVDQKAIQYLREVCQLYKKGIADQENTLLKALLIGLFQNEAIPQLKLKNKHSVIRSVKSLIEEKKSELVYMKDLVEASGMSERAIQYAFKEEYGVTPLEYVKSKKLHCTYLELAENSNASISDVANRNGFWHMGQFAADFRRKYGILPSQQRENTRKIYVS